MDSDSTETVCLVCYEELEDDAPQYKCGNDCHLCLDCFGRFAMAKLEQGQLKVTCPGQCMEEKVLDTLVQEQEGVDDELKQTIVNGVRRICDPTGVECPACSEFQSAGSRQTVRCTNCRVVFCTVHGLDHAGSACPTSTSAFKRWRDRMWVKLHTKECPGCHNRIQKNGGCNHMTCRCGHEMCWCCGGDYVKNGRRGHGQKLFPAPSDLKYQCNSSKMWAKRVGAVAVGVPLAVGAAALAIGVAIPTIPTIWAVRTVKDRRERRRNRQRREQQARQVTSAEVAGEVERSLCAHYHDSDFNAFPCLSCAGVLDCVHPQQERTPADFCGLCNHYVQSEACAHFFGSAGHGTCVFCGHVRVPTDLEVLNASAAASSFTSDTETDADDGDDEDDDGAESAESVQQGMSARAQRQTLCTIDFLLNNDVRDFGVLGNDGDADADAADDESAPSDSWTDTSDCESDSDVDGVSFTDTDTDTDSGAESPSKMAGLTLKQRRRPRLKSAASASASASAAHDSEMPSYQPRWGTQKKLRSKPAMLPAWKTKPKLSLALTQALAQRHPQPAQTKVTQRVSLRPYARRIPQKEHRICSVILNRSVSDSQSELRS
eukprot:m.87049 g.87049  ORF g.87049 m.87049 type:complete len:602 (-) comp12825_c0_seq6:183-1988(-)